MSLPDISVVIPIYNTAEFLPQCLNSMINQMGCARMEVILVDDGSTDQSGQICDDYAFRFPELFKVIHKKNGGSASARQAGWNVARGTYITVCDSDDWVDKSAYSKLLFIAQKDNADVVICDFCNVYNNDAIVPISMRLSGNETQDSILKKSLSSNILNSSCNKIFKRSLFTDNNLKWTNGINLGEDALMWSRILCLPSINLSYLPEPLYYYRRRYGEDTYTNKLTQDKWEQLQRVYEIQKTLFPLKSLTDCACDIAFAGLRTEGLPKHQLKRFIDKNIKLRYLFAAKPKRLIALSAKMVGIDVTKFIIRKLYKFVYR